LNENICKFELLQKDSSRGQSADSSKAYKLTARPKPADIFG